MDEAKLRELVSLALGKASMCWSEIPTGVFDSEKMKRIDEELIQAIKELMG